VRVRAPRCMKRLSFDISRHCERSEAIQPSAKKAWIASSLRSSQ
jgi:hypothetical protein